MKTVLITSASDVANAVEGLLGSFSDHITGINFICDGGFILAYYSNTSLDFDTRDPSKCEIGQDLNVQKSNSR